MLEPVPLSAEAALEIPDLPLVCTYMLYTMCTCMLYTMCTCMLYTHILKEINNLERENNSCLREWGEGEGARKTQTTQ